MSDFRRSYMRDWIREHYEDPEALEKLNSEFSFLICVFHSKAAIHYTAKLPPISHESCHPLHGKAATFEEVDNRRV